MFAIPLRAYMSQVESSVLLKTPLHARHVALGARMVPFGGWDMPVEYSGITAEHMAVRTAAGLFDVSHMGEVEIAGKDALEAVQHITSNDASKLQVGQIQYSGLTHAEGTFVDDLLVYRFGPSHFLLVINAGNIEGLRVDPRARAGSRRRVARELERPLRADRRAGTEGARDPPDADGDRPARSSTTGSRTAKSPASAARCRAPATPGEDGFEVMVPPAMAARVWDALLEAGEAARPHPVRASAPATRCASKPRCACTATTSTKRPPSSKPTSAGSSAGTRKSSSAATCCERRRPPARKLVGFEMTERAIARHGHPVLINGQQVGVVTSGTQTPFLKKAIGMAYVPPALNGRGTELEIDIRGRRAKARVVAAAVLQATQGR